KIDVLSGARNFDQLDISRDGRDAVIEFGRTTVTLKRFDADRLDEGDFLFRGRAAAEKPAAATEPRLSEEDHLDVFGEASWLI
ncbi:MAG: hypothetical protein AAFP78_06155, partial [Pseudomonadota bacterium]